MATATIAPPTFDTFADLLERLGHIPPERIRLRPLPGQATEDDVIHCKSRFNCLCELVDGVLVEKPMGFYESRLAVVLIGYLEAYLSKHDIGIVLGADGLLRFAPGLVRVPDVSFFAWRRFPGRLLPSGAFLEMTPDLAVEILSPTNTEKEMARKRHEYFAGGTKLVWEADPEKRSVRVYTSPTRFKTLTEADTLEGGRVLPGFKLSIQQWFARAGRRRGQ